MTSTERPQENPADSVGHAGVPRRRRRPRFAVATVAAAVLIAGGGGAYFATNAFGGSGTDGGGPGGEGPPPLALDTGLTTEAGPATPADASAPPAIAPGEPDPSGVTYRAKGKLPDGPDTAGVYRTNGSVAADEVARLAKALGLTGPPASDGAAWRIGPDRDGSGPVLRVAKQAPGTWTFSQFGPVGGDNCVKGRKSCPAGGPGSGSSLTGSPLTGDDSGSGSAVSETAAKEAAAPVLKALGQDDADLDARQLMGSTRVVNADPVVGGLPTYGWSTGIQVGTDGKVIGGSGQLKEPERGDSYPVIGADEALKQLNRAADATGSGSGVGGCATAVPAAPLAPALPAVSAVPLGKERQLFMPCGAQKVAPGKSAATVEIDRAVFGLAMRSVGGQGALVPSWLFEVAPEGDGAPYTVTQPAVAAKYLKPAPAASEPAESPREGQPGDSPAEPGKAAGSGITSYTVAGRTLTLHFMGGVCSVYTPQADEGDAAVKVKLAVSHPEPGRICIAMAKEQSAQVTLDRPLGTRQVVDAQTGERIARD
ncbi:hypothetical protein ACIOWG_15955 [Streptomyces sp. NPDC087658]|uniref:hypothetical protein n=1 Tax=Streptomyces sp. NPDC087658 TaxID=3365800 RepID=UPI00382510B0